MGADYRETVLSFINLRGPSLPIHISKHLNTNTLMASAMLSELASKKAVKISALKVGGSPLYYIPGQEEKLLAFISNLNEKDRRTVELLQQHKILRDREQDPLIRVSLRQIKDFAIPLDVTAGQEKELFWKWFQVPDDQATPLIKKNLGIEEKQQKIIPEEAPAQKTLPVPKTAQPERKPAQKRTLKSEALHEILSQYALSKNMAISEQTVVKKGEIDCLAAVPTPVGQVLFFCKARQKEKITDADISSAVVQGQLRKLPVLFMTTGQLNKKAEEIARQTSVTVAKLYGSKDS